MMFFLQFDTNIGTKNFVNIKNTLIIYAFVIIYIVGLEETYTPFLEKNL